MIIRKHNTYHGQFVAVDVDDGGVDGGLILTLNSKYRSDGLYLILDEAKKISEVEFLDLVVEELKTIKIMVEEDYGKQK